MAAISKRRKKSEEAKQSETSIRVWLTHAEKDRIHEEAVAAGLSDAGFLRGAAEALADALAEVKVWRGQASTLNAVVKNLSEMLAEATKGRKS